MGGGGPNKKTNKQTKQIKSKLQNVGKGEKWTLFSPKLPSQCGLIEIDGNDNRAHLIEFYS